ncbi:MAG: DoxX family protein [Beijerinckiaceae bacterium]|nr:DoxX family protein [Beijerinckiaceae bacterium]
MSALENAGGAATSRETQWPFMRALGLLDRVFAHIPQDLLAALARFSIAAVFWKSGQTKVDNFSIDIIDGRFSVGVPRFAEATIDLFKEEYRLPILPPELAAFAATVAEHVFPVLILLGLATRLSAFALLIMTLVIQIFVYPGAYALHGVWAVCLLYLMREGAGRASLDYLIHRRA